MVFSAFASWQQGRNTMPDEAPQEENSPHRGKAGVLASIQASVGVMNMKREPRQHQKVWKLWRDRFE